MNPCKATIIFSALLSLAAFSTVLSQNAELEEAKQYFNNGEFEQASTLLERLISTKTLAKSDHREAAEYLAVTYVSNDQDRQAKMLFANLLHEDASYKPSDHWWPHKRLMANYYKTVKESGLSLSVSERGPGIKTIAIIDFENNSVDDFEKYQNLGNALSKIMINDFDVLSSLQIVERERLQFLLDELELTDKKVGGKKIMDPANAPRIGKLLGAHSFVFGSFIRLGKVFRLDVRLVKTETGEIFKTASVQGKPDDVFELVKKLTIKITESLDIDIKKIEKEKLDEMGKEDVPIEALALFGDAMSDANIEDYHHAVVKLEEALAVAPGFGRARDMLDTIKPLTL